MYDVVFVQCVTSVDTEMEVSICLLIDVQSGGSVQSCRCTQRAGGCGKVKVAPPPFLSTESELQAAL